MLDIYDYEVVGGCDLKYLGQRVFGNYGYLPIWRHTNEDVKLVRTRL